MGISGNLKTMQLPELLQWLSMGQKTGTLRIEKAHSNVIKRIYFDDGVIISSASTDPGEYLGRFLVTHGYLAEDEVNQAVARQQEKKQLLGRILVDMELISEDNLNQMLRLKAEESIYDVFTWPEGAFEFLDGELPGENMVRMELDVQWLVLEGSRRTDEWRRIEQLIPSNLCVPVLVTDINSLALAEFERGVLEWVDDDRTVEEISQGAMVNLFSVSEIFAKHVENGWLKMVRPRIIEIKQESTEEKYDDAETIAIDAGPQAEPESGALYLPMMQQMMQQLQQQQIQMLHQQSASQAQGVPTPAVAVPAAAVAAPPTGNQPAIDMGSGRSLNFATTTDSAPAAAAEEAPSTIDSKAERLLQEADRHMKNDDLARSLDAFRQAKKQGDADAAIDIRVEKGERALAAALERAGLDLKSVPKLKCDLNDLTELDISPQEGFMLTRIDGRYDIKSILRISPLPKLDALVLFWRLRKSGHVAV